MNFVAAKHREESSVVFQESRHFPLSEFAQASFLLTSQHYFEYFEDCHCYVIHRDVI